MISLRYDTDGLFLISIVLRKIVFFVFEPPKHDLIKNRHQVTAPLGERILYMRRDFIELYPVDEPVPFQFPQGVGQHGIGDARKFLF